MSHYDVDCPTCGQLRFSAAYNKWQDCECTKLKNIGYRVYRVYMQQMRVTTLWAQNDDEAQETALKDWPSCEDVGDPMIVDIEDLTDD